MTADVTVQPKKSNPYGKHLGWVIHAGGLGTTGKLYNKKSEALRRAKELARQEARQERYETTLKIYGKDGSYQRQHKYQP